MILELYRKTKLICLICRHLKTLPPWRPFDSWDKKVEVWQRVRRCQRSEVLPVRHRQELSSTQPPAIFLAPKPAVKGQSILCCMPRYLPFLLAKIPHWPPAEFPLPPLNPVALLQMRFKLFLCVVHYFLNSCGTRQLLFSISNIHWVPLYYYRDNILYYSITESRWITSDVVLLLCPAFISHVTLLSLSSLSPFHALM